ncbi:MAG: hypothetical protein ACFE0Q_17905 [Anaerolineae bacterium]
MIRIRQIEVNALIFNQYDNGISEIIYQESSERAVEGFFYFIDMVIKEAHAQQTIYWLNDLSRTEQLPLADYYAKIVKLNTKYPLGQRPPIRFADIHAELTEQRRMVLAYMRLLKLPGLKLNMFSSDQRQEAISWLLRGRP